MQPFRQLGGNDIFYWRAHFTADQFVFGLAAEFGFGYFDADNAGQAFAHIVARDFDFGFFRQVLAVDVLLDNAGHSRARAG